MASALECIPTGTLLILCYMHTLLYFHPSAFGLFNNIMDGNVKVNLFFIRIVLKLNFCRFYINTIYQMLKIVAVVLQ